ncbi:MAG TPA: glycoside hydrolase family 38 C-terminal domain-containing protein [Cellulomonas sp.]
MQTDAARVLQRLERFTHERVLPAVHPERVPLEVTAWDVPGEPVPFAEAVAQQYRPAPLGTPWGAPWSTTWFRMTGAVPAAWTASSASDGDEGRYAVELVIDLGFTTSQTGFQAEGLVLRPDGVAVKGLSPFNQTVPWTGERVDVLVEAAGNPDIGSGSWYAPTPLGDPMTAGTEPLYALRTADVALRDVQVWELWQDIVAVQGLVGVLDPTSTRYARALRAADLVVDAVDPQDVAGTAAAGRAVLAPVLAVTAAEGGHRVLATGHAHIDSAWLWPVRETVRKCTRTFASVVALMDQREDFVFACSSAQQYAWVQERQPELFERIRAKVDAGQFVPVGGMWVESDTNMPGGEALARQMVEGKRYFLDELGVETQDVWLPDSFGYTGALPQLVRAAGSRWFLSQKLSWNDTNRMPHHTFWWEGIDGSRVLAHFPPVDTYNSDLSARELVHAERNFADKATSSISLVPFGWGDGGGGPTREMLASADRFRSVDGVPQVELGSPNTFFARAEAELAELDEASGPGRAPGVVGAAGPGDQAVWSGEMYLEYHRGTYTSQSRTKRGNRRSEHLLREAELWAATAAVRTGAEYPAAELRGLWREVLLHQFHDILPGSSIGWVYRQAEEAYARIEVRLEAIVTEALAALVGQGDRTVALNAAPHARDGIAALGGAVRPDGDDGPAGTAGAAGRAGGSGVAGGSGAVGGSPSGAVALHREPDGTLRVVTDVLDVHLTAGGQIDSLRDLVADREVVPAGSLANLLQLHRDVPRQWDAWDIDAEYRRTVEDLVDASAVEVAVEKVDRVVLRSVRVAGKSTLTQELTFLPGVREIAIVTDVDWHERQRLLKLAFPLDVHADRSAAETQFGHVQRATHTNTSWDEARYEICAHRWLHVGEPGYGVAVANDATYGHDVTRTVTQDGRTATVVRQSLLRAPLFPDPEADQGRHVFRTVLHVGATIADAVVDGYRTNLPVREVAGERGVDPLVTVSAPGVVVEAVKLADDGSGDVVVRLYEAHGRRSRAQVRAGFAVGAVTETDLLERTVPPRAVTGAATGGAAGAEVGAVGPGAGGDGTAVGAGVDLDLRPFQLVTLRFAR